MGHPPTPPGGDSTGGDMSSLKTSQVIGKVETMGNVMLSSSQKKEDDGKEKTQTAERDPARGHPSHPTSVQPLHTLQI